MSLAGLRCDYDVREATSEVGADVAVDDGVHAAVGVGETLGQHAIDLVPSSGWLQAAVDD